MSALKRTTRRKKSKALAPSQEWQLIKGVKRERLILERKKRKLTQAQLAKQLGTSASMISLIETGRNKPGFELSVKFEEFFELPFEILFPDL